MYFGRQARSRPPASQERSTTCVFASVIRDDSGYWLKWFLRDVDSGGNKCVINAKLTIDARRLLYGRYCTGLFQ